MLLIVYLQQIWEKIEYRINKVKEMYKDTYNEAKKHINQSDKSRAS